MSFEDINKNTNPLEGFHLEDIEKAIIYLNITDISILKNKESVKDMMSEFSSLEETFREKAKEDMPSSFEEFMLVRNNFQLHWSSGFAGDIYRTMSHYKQYIENENNVGDLNNKLSEYMSSENFSEKPQLPSPANHIFGDNIRDVYTKMYEAYLLMRKYTEKDDSELYT